MSASVPPRSPRFAGKMASAPTSVPTFSRAAWPSMPPAQRSSVGSLLRTRPHAGRRSPRRKCAGLFGIQWGLEGRQISALRRSLITPPGRIDTVEFGYLEDNTGVNTESRTSFEVWPPTATPRTSSSGGPRLCQRRRTGLSPLRSCGMRKRPSSPSGAGRSVILTRVLPRQTHHSCRDEGAACVTRACALPTEQSSGRPVRSALPARDRQDGAQQPRAEAIR
jgi:hypothetical protein